MLNVQSSWKLFCWTKCFIVSVEDVYFSLLPRRIWYFRLMPVTIIYGDLGWNLIGWSGLIFLP